MKLFFKLFFSLFLVTCAFDTIAQCPSVLSGGSDKFPNKICAPVTADLNLAIQFLTPIPNTSVIEAVYIWGDGTSDTVIPLASGTDTYNVTSNHNFPEDNNCEYLVEMYLRIDNVVCTSTRQTQRIASWRPDDYAGGSVRLQSPQGNNIYEVCEGEDISVVFDDVTNWNCNVEVDPLPNLPETPNEQVRWQQIVYNTPIGGSKIPNISVNGTSITDGSGGDIISDYQDTRGVFFMSDPVVLNDPRRRPTLSIDAPGGFGAGFPQLNDEFEITLRYWNFCNPYDDPAIPGPPADLINGDNLPVENTAIIRIVESPADPVPNNNIICAGELLPDFTISTPQPSFFINWFDGDPALGGVSIATANPNSTTLPVADYPGGIDNTVGGIYSVWATYNGIPGMQCESDAVEVILEIKPELQQPGIILPTNAVCKDAQDVTFGLFDPPGANVKYTWSVSGSGISIDGPNEGNSVLVDFNVPGTFTSKKRKISVIREYTSGPSCTSVSQSFDIPISGGPTATVTGGGAVCAGNPATDITWTFESDFATDFDFEIEIYEGTSPAVLVSTITENGWTSDTYSIVNPTPSVNTEYRLVSLTDAAGCAVTLTASAFVSIGGTPPVVDNITVGTPVCENGASTAPAGISIDLTENSVRNYELQYIIDGGAIITKILSSDINGIIVLSPDYVNELASTSGSYDYEILSIKDVATTCSVDVNEIRTVIINARPGSPDNPTDVAVCQPDIGSTSIQVDIPGGNLTIDWYDADLPGGAILLSGNNSITPATAGTYFAETRNTLTGCTSANRIPVNLFEDIPPSASDAGTPPPPFCATSVTLNAVSPANGRGTWSVPGLLFAEHFTNLPNGTLEDNDFFGWDVNVTPNTIFPPNDYFEVRGQKFSGRDLNEEAVWYTKTIDISALTTIDLSLNVDELGDLEAAGTGRDYIGVYYQIDGGIETLVGSELAGNFNSEIIQGSFPTGGGSNLIIVIRVKTDSGDEIINFDDLVVKSASLSMAFEDVNDPGSVLSGLPVGVTPLTWTVTSNLGICALTTQTINIERLPPPANVDPQPQVCEDISGDGESVVNLNDYKQAIVGAAVAGDRTVAWFEDAARTMPVADVTSYVANNTTKKSVYNIVQNDITGCTSSGTITFTVVGLPEANDMVVELCEDVLDDGTVDNVDLETYEGDVIAPANALDRTVTWYTDLDLTTAVASPTDVDGLSNGQAFYARVDNAAAGCFDVAELKFIVNSKPKDNPVQLGGLTPSSVTFCKNNTDPVFFQVSGSLNINSTYQWTLPATGEFVLESGATLDNFFLPVTFPVSIPAPGLPITLVETSEDGCIGNVNTINIIVVDIPEKPVITGNADVCIGEENATFSIESPNPGSQYVWEVPGAFGFIVSGQNSEKVKVTIGNNTGPYQIKVTEISSNDCTSPEADPFDVEVHTKPVMISGNNFTICSGAQVDDQITFTADNPSATFFWKVISASASIVGTAFGNTGTGNINEVLTNTSLAVGNVTYEVIPRGPAPGNCDGAPQFVFISVEPVPGLSVSSSSAICSGEEINIEVKNTVSPTNRSDLSFRVDVASSDPAATGGTAYADKSDLLYPTTLMGTLTNSSSSPVDVTFRLYPEFNGCAQNPDNYTDVIVVVDPLPLANDLSKVACSDVIINKVTTLDLTTLETEINGDPAVTISWFRDPFLNSPIASPTNYTVFDNIPVYARVDNGNCTNVAEVSYLINSKPQVSAVVASDYDGFGVSCIGAEDGSIATTVSDAAGPLTFELLNKDKISMGKVNGSGVFSNLTAGQYHVKVTDDNGCEGMTVIPAIINSPFELSGGFVFGTQNICEGEAPDKFTELSSPFGGTGNYSYQWKISTDGVAYNNIAGANAAEYQHGALVSAGSYYFKRSVNTDNGCGPIESNEGLPLQVRVNPTPTMDLAFVDPKISSPLDNKITEICQGQVFYIEFTFPNGTGPFKFDYNNGTNFNNDVFGADPTRITYPNGIENDLTINITNVKDAFGCSLDLNITKTLRVIELESEFTVLNTPICTGETVDFEYFDASGITYTWDFGDGQTESFIGSGVGVNTISHVYNSGNFTTAVNFPVRLTVDRGTCLATKIKDVRVQPSVMANIIPSAIQICSGEEITFKNASLGVDVSTWYYREKGTNQKLEGQTTSSDLVKAFVNNDPGKNPVTLEMVYEGKNNEGCSDSQVIEFAVYQNPKAAIDVTAPVPEFTAGQSRVTFDNNSTVPDKGNFAYKWDFGNDADPKTLGLFDAPDPVTYNTPGQKNISFYTYNLAANAVGLTCASEDALVINIVRPPISADFKLDPVTGCSPLTVNVIENNSSGADSFFWSVVNQANETVFISTEVLPQFTISKPGEYNVYLLSKYEDTGQEVLSAPSKIIVHQLPVASFDVRPDLVYLPDELLRTFNFSGNADTYEWDFGDGSPVAAGFDPEHLYESEGFFDVRLTAYRNYDDGIVCSDSAVVTVEAREGGSTRIPNAFTPNTNGPSSDGRIQREVDNDIFLPITKGVEEFQMLVFDRWGNLLFESNNQSVGWDGYDKNDNLLPAGVYVYKLTLRLSNGERTTRIGDITLIR